MENIIMKIFTMLTLGCLVMLFLYSPALADEPDTTFAGSQSCQGCHSAEYTEWQKSGHAYMLVRSEGANPPEYPDLEIDMNVGGRIYWFNDYTINFFQT